MVRKKSWKTTAAAITAIIVAIGSMVVEPLLDNDPETKPDWQACVSIVVAASIGFWTRDDDKSSEQVGAGNTGKDKS